MDLRSLGVVQQDHNFVGSFRHVVDGQGRVQFPRTLRRAMSPEAQEKCFEPFYTTRGEEGSGLGLSTVRKIVSRHRGTIDVDSEEGEGTTFTVLLPAAEPRPEQAPDEHETPDVGQLHILLVEDEPMQRETLSEYLTEAGHTVDAASDGHEGMEAFDPGAHDLVITDQAMPCRSGDEVAHEVKSRAPDLPVLLLTGFGSMAGGPEGSPGHIDRVVSKPVTPEELRGAIARLVAGRRG